MIKNFISGIRKTASRLSLRIAFWVPLITFGPVNLYVYRQSDPSEIRDLGVWIRAAESITNQEDPYVTSGGLFKSGPISSFLLLGLRVLLFQNEALFFYLTMCLNLMGMMAFTVWFSRYFKIHNITLLACNSIIICSSFTREMLVTGQVTGLIFGALALIAHLSDKFLFNKTFYVLPLITLLSALVIDLKPNIFLFPFLAIILIYRNSMMIKTLITVPILYTILFLGLIQWTEVNLLKSWIRNLNAINDYTSNNTLFGSKNGWQVINGLVESNGLPFLFSVIPVVTYLLVGIVGLLLVGKARPAIGLSFTLISPFFYTYFHFYSFFPLALVFSLYLSQKRNYLLMGVFLSTFLASYRVVENLPVLIIAVILLVPILSLDASIKDIFLFVLGWLSFIPARLALLNIVQGEIQYMSVLLSLLMLLWFSLFVHVNQKREAVAVK